MPSLEETIRDMNESLKRSADHANQELDRCRQAIQTIVQQWQTTRDERNRLNVALKNLIDKGDGLRHAIVQPEFLDAVQKEYDELTEALERAEQVIL